MVWTEVQVDKGSEAPVGRGGAACVAIGGRSILLFGGASRDPAAFDDWWLMELSDGRGGGTWTRISPVVKLSHKRKLLPRSGASLTYIPAADGDGGSSGGQVYLFGGQDPVTGVIFDDLLCLDVGSWELSDVQLERGAGQPPPPRPPGRHSHVAGVYEQWGLIVYGGAGLRGPMADVWLLEPAQRQWRCLSAALHEGEGPEPREMAAGCMISDAGLLVHGGRAADGTLLQDIAIFDGRAGRWVLHHDTGFPRTAHTACNAAAAAVQQPSSSSDAAAPPAAEAAADMAGGQLASSNTAPPPVSSSGTTPVAANVLLYGGFTGEMVTGELLQLTFLRQHRSGNHSLRAELRPVKAVAGGAPPPRFAHAAAALSGPEAVVIVGGVNQTDDLADVHIWTV